MRVQLMDLRSRHHLGHSLGQLGGEDPVLLTVNEFLTPGDLEFPILLNEREGIDGFIGERDAIDGGTYVCCLRRSYALVFKATWRFGIVGRT